MARSSSHYGLREAPCCSKGLLFDRRSKGLLLKMRSKGICNPRIVCAARLQIRLERGEFHLERRKIRLEWEEILREREKIQIG